MSTMTLPPLLALVADEGWELHYAPVHQGGLLVKKDGQTKTPENWAKHHELMAAFQEHRASGHLVHSGEFNYGHELFHGHSGRVDVYTWKKETS